MEQSQDIIVSIRIFEFHPRLMMESRLMTEFVYHQYPKNVLKTRNRKVYRDITSSYLFMAEESIAIYKWNVFCSINKSAWTIVHIFSRVLQ